MPTLLELENLTVYFGGLTAVNGVSLKIEEGQINALIGPNGAGKSTIFNVITGIYPPNVGRIWFQGQDITRKKNPSDYRPRDCAHLPEYSSFWRVIGPG